MNLKNLSYNKDEGVIVLKDVRLSYPHLFKPWAQQEDQEKKYSGRFLVSEETHSPEIEWLQKHLLGIQKEVFKARIPADKLCFRDGNLTGKPEDEGQWYLAANEKTKPATVDRHKREVVEADDVLYGGCYVNVMFKLWTQNNKYGKRINANLLAVQFFRDGERFGAPRPDVDKYFDEFEGGDEDGFED